MLGFRDDTLYIGASLAGLDASVAMAGMSGLPYDREMTAGTDDEDSDVYDISGPEDLNVFLKHATGARDTATLLKRLGRPRVNAKLKPSPFGKAVARMARVSRGLLAHTGMIEASRLQKPNTLASIYTTALASGASVAFSVQPGVGLSYYRVLGFICSDEQANIMGFSSLKIGGQEHVQVSQSTPTPPVASAVPWAMFTLREPSLIANINPWVGQVFDNNTPMTGTVVNVTTAAASDAATVAGRLCILIQTDPCGRRMPQLDMATQQFWGTARKNGLMYLAGLHGAG